jgi:hypothetical protein
MCTDNGHDLVGGFDEMDKVSCVHVRVHVHVRVRACACVIQQIMHQA